MIDHDCDCYDCNVHDRQRNALSFTFAVLVLLFVAIVLASSGCSGG